MYQYGCQNISTFNEYECAFTKKSHYLCKKTTNFRFRLVEAETADFERLEAEVVAVVVHCLGVMTVSIQWFRNHARILKPFSIIE